MEDILKIDNNKNRDPNNVYKNKQKLALTLLLEPNNPINKNKGGKILSKKIQNNNISNIKKTINKDVSNNKIIIKKIIVFSFIDFQLDIIDIGIIIVVNNTKYMDKPSTPK